MPQKSKPAGELSPTVTWKNIQVGSVSVNVKVPTETERKRRVDESKTVSGRLGKAILTPGVRLSVKATTPTYAADAKDPDLVVRKVGTKVTRGIFKNGEFVKVA